MTGSQDNYKRNFTQSDIASLVSEINEINNHIKSNLDILEKKYHITEKQQEIIYENIQKIVDVTIDCAKIPKNDYKLISPVWTEISSEYLLDLTIIFERKKSGQDVSMHPMMCPITKEFAENYLNNLLLINDIETSNFPKDKLMFDLKESGLSTDTLTSRLGNSSPNDE